MYICHDSIHKSSSWFPSLAFINNFCLALSCWLGRLCSLFFYYTLHFFTIMPRFFRSGAISILMFTRTLQFYLAFETIYVTSQKPCILHTNFTQAYWALDTLSCTIINSCLHVQYFKDLGWYTFKARSKVLKALAAYAHMVACIQIFIVIVFILVIFVYILVMFTELFASLTGSYTVKIQVLYQHLLGCPLACLKTAPQGCWKKC